MAKFGLGKGLGALIPEHQQYFDPVKNQAEVETNIRILPLSSLRPNPDQPRKRFTDTSIDELADSIRRHGLLQPLIVEPSGPNDYIIVAGERRFRAASRAGLTEVPAIIKSLTSDKRLQVSLIENIQREDLNPMEEAEAYRNLMDITGYTQEQVAEAVGKNRSTVANALRLTRLSTAMQDAVRSGEISAGHARSLLGIQDANARERLFRKIIAEGLSVRQTEAATQEGLSSPGKKKKKGEADKPTLVLDPDLGALKEMMIERLGTKVEITGNLEKGKIAIDYFTSDDLQRILEVMGAVSL